MAKGMTDAERLGRIELAKPKLTEDQIKNIEATTDVKKKYEKMMTYIRALDKRPKIVKDTVRYFEDRHPNYTDYDILIESLNELKANKKEEHKKILLERQAEIAKELESL